MDTQQCIICGCTDDDCRQCVEAQGYPCQWIDENLCSRCAIEAAAKFHEIHERLAPEFGYVTHKETRTLDPLSPNGRLMIQTVTEFLCTHIFKPGSLYLPAEEKEQG